MLVNPTCASGIIPADAGSTSGIARNREYNMDHPRGCGEHQGNIYGDHLNMGSSPRMRGAHYLLFFASSALRIIPADAGST